MEMVTNGPRAYSVRYNHNFWKKKKKESGIIQKNKLVFIPGTQNQAESLNVKFLHIMHTKNRGHIFEIRKKHIIEMIK